MSTISALSSISVKRAYKSKKPIDLVNLPKMIAREPFIVPDLSIDPFRLHQVFTHTSITSDVSQNNRRFSFLGDAMANMLIAYIVTKTTKACNVGTQKAHLQSDKNFIRWAFLLKFPDLELSEVPLSKTSKFHATVFEAYVGAVAYSLMKKDIPEGDVFVALIDWFKSLIVATDPTKTLPLDIFSHGHDNCIGQAANANILGGEVIRYVFTKMVFMRLPQGSLHQLETARSGIFKSKRYQVLKKKGLPFVQGPKKGNILLQEVGQFLLQSADPQDFTHRLEELEHTHLRLFRKPRATP